jgi:hypothetical protein
LVSVGWLVYGAQCRFQQYFSYIVAVSFIGGRNWSTRRKPPSCRKSLANFTSYCVIQTAEKKPHRLKIASIRKSSVAITHPNHNFSSKEFN